ncbi:MAG: PhzF family phenazine biosynthesis protein [Balneolaceae bacterium]|nr:PhzF family phenazine biosynthesis protein [Balneolaceae bacterium]
MKLDLYQADAFTSDLFGGNPAAVCPLKRWIPEELMQQIAGENNLSETAFFVHSSGRYELRWFTPETEVDLCGHATLASAHILFNHLGYDRDRVHFDTRSGELTVERQGDLLVMNFPSNPADSVELPDRMEEALGVRPSECYQAMDYLLILDEERQVREVEPEFLILKQMDSRGFIVSAPGEEVDFVSRFFAPGAGINEDPVTGSAHTTLTPYWAERLGKNALRARQLSRRGGELQCRLLGDRVEIAGRARTYMRGVINLPD